ncbi:MAG: DUF6600 domain-containing protein [Blastocatellia bacterium]
MKNRTLILALVSAALLFNPGFNARVYAAPQAVTVDTFYQSLGTYGHWFSHDRLGWVWMPYDVSVSWRPYSVGQLAYSDYGWTWDSDEPWGWATYHYGRWQFDANYGWLWIPGTVWGPAWVSWRFGDGYCGWAPLPPLVGWDSGLVLGGLDLDEYIPPFWYNFVEERYFATPHIHDHLLLPARNVSLIGQTRNITRYEVNGNRIINRSVDVDRLEKDTGHSISRYRVMTANSPAAQHQASVRDGEMSIYKPDVTQPTEGHAPRPLSSDRLSPVLDQNRGDATVTGRQQGDVVGQSNRSADELAKQQQQEKRMLEQQQNDDREALRQQHREELAHPPSGMSPGDLDQRHQNEQREFEEQSKRESHVLNNWHGLGRVGGVSPGGRRH